MSEVGLAPVDARTSRWPATAGDVALALLPAALTVYLSLRDGGFFPGSAAWAAAEVALCIAVFLVIASRPWGGLSIPLAVAIAAIGGMAAWTLISSDWSGSAVRSIIEYTRVLLYALTLILFGLLPFSIRRIRWMLYGLAAATAAVCGLALIARTLPEVIFDPGLNEYDRLGYPLSYWNGLGFLAALGAVVCIHLACSARDRWHVRVLGAAAVPLFAATLYYTLSRGGTWAALGAVAVYLIVGRPRAMIGGLVAVAPPVVVMLVLIDPPGALTKSPWAVPEAAAAGHRAALVIGLSALAAGVLRWAARPLDALARNIRLPERARRAAMAAATVGLLAATLAVAVAFDIPDVVSTKYSEFNSGTKEFASQGSGRLTSASDNGRHKHWEVALAAYRRDKLHGSGAGTFSIEWARERPDSSSVQDAHSFYFESLGELGWPGFLLGAVSLLLILGAFAFRARGQHRAMFAALLAGALAWAGQASVDWLWEMPAVTLWLFAFGGAALAKRADGDARLPAWTIGVRVAGVAACLALIVLPARVALSQVRLDSSLEAVTAGNCERAAEDSRSALSALGERASPYHVIGFCAYQQGRPDEAVRAMREAVERDPGNWKLRYGLALARGAAGLDPRAEIARARRLNPRDQFARVAAKAFRRSEPGRWPRAARRFAIPAPGPPVP